MRLRDLITAFGRDRSGEETADFALKLLGMDTASLEDGGPGSGNWGHMGRPGKRGGSGKGGGTHYRTGSKEEGYRQNKEVVHQVKAPERTEKSKGKKIETTFNNSKNGGTWGSSTLKHQEENYKDAQKLAKEAFGSGDAEGLADAVGRLASAASWSDAWKSGNAVPYSAEVYGVSDVPREWTERLTAEEEEVLRNINEEYSNLDWRDTDQWIKDHPEENKLMVALQAKLLGAEIEPEMSDDILEKYAGIEKHEEVPGQMSMFLGENVPSNQTQTGGMLERAKAENERTFEASASNLRPKCFETDRQVMKGFDRIEGDHSWKDDLKKVNPGFWEMDLWDENGNSPYTVNCQRCITAYEARRRGFDVEADVVLNDSQKTAYGWYDSFNIKAGSGIHPGFDKNRPALEQARSPISPEELRKNTDIEMLKMGDGARCVLSVDWKNNNNGHVFIAENHNGVIKYIDPQSGKEDCTELFDRIVPLTMTMIRIDDKPLGEQASRWCVKP